MINYYETIDFDALVIADGETTRLRDLAAEWADQTTTPFGIGNQFFADGLELRAWGPTGSGDRLICEFETEAEAEHACLLCHLHDLNTNIEAPEWEFA